MSFINFIISEQRRQQINEDLGNLKFLAKNGNIIKRLKAYMRTSLIGQASVAGDPSLIKRGRWSTLKTDYEKDGWLGAVVLTTADGVPRAILLKEKPWKGAPAGYWRSSLENSHGIVSLRGAINPADDELLAHIGIDTTKNLHNAGPSKGVSWLQDIAKFLKNNGVESYLVYIMTDTDRTAASAERSKSREGMVPLPRNGTDYKHFLLGLQRGLRGRLQDYISQKVSKGFSSIDPGDSKTFGLEIAKVLTSPGAKAVQIGKFVYNIEKLNRADSRDAAAGGRLVAQFQVTLRASPSTLEKIEAEAANEISGPTPTGYDFTLSVFMTFDGTPPVVDVEDLRARMS